MKTRIIALTLALTTLFALASSTSICAESGPILLTDDFSSTSDQWLWNGSMFYIESADGGRLEGRAEAPQITSTFLVGGPGHFGDFALKIKAQAFDDGGKDAQRHRLGASFTDHIKSFSDDSEDGGIVYSFVYEFETRTLMLCAAPIGTGERYMPDDVEPFVPFAQVEIPRDRAPEIGYGESAFMLGVRLDDGVISVYLNDRKYVETDAFRGEQTCTEFGTAITLLNYDCFCAFDDLIVTEAGYDLFGDGFAAQKGDVNGDGDVNARDVTALMIIMILPEPISGAHTDVNGDGRVNARDVVTLMKMIMPNSIAYCAYEGGGARRSI